MRYVLDVPDLVIGGLSIDPILAFGGLLAGLLVGLTGMGGAALVTPMLVLVFSRSSVNIVNLHIFFHQIFYHFEGPLHPSTFFHS